MNKRPIVALATLLVLSLGLTAVGAGGLESLEREEAERESIQAARQVAGEPGEEEDEGEVRGPLSPDGETHSPAPLDPGAPTTMIGPIVKTFPAARSLNMDVRQIPRNYLAPPTLREELRSPGQDTNATTAATGAVSAPLVQAATTKAPSATNSYLGLDLATWGNGWPADPNGDVGPNHYIEGVNTSVGIFDKATGTRVAAFSFNDFFRAAGATNACANYNYGDPYVIYDRVSGRWFVSDFAFANASSGPYFQCIAVSKTSDPVKGGWWAYSYLVSNTQMNDYPKFAAWNDGIYMTANLFTYGRSYYGTQVAAFNRDELISGAALTIVYFTMPYNSTYGYPYSLLAANDESGTSTGPEYIYSDDSGLTQWRFVPNWTTPSSSTLSSAVKVSGVPSYTKPSGNAPQPAGTGSLDQLGDRLMSAAQWSNASGTPSVWLARTVTTSAGPSGVLWMEVAPGASPSLKQSGIFAPGDGLYRFMPTIAVDGYGTMAVGYTTSSRTANPSIAYASRSAGGATGTLDLGEAVLQAGGGSQTNYSRWGDYFSMSIDPVDDCTFWMTGAYLATTSNNWQTRIVSFKPGTCVSTPVAPSILSVSPTSAPVGATVSISGSNFTADTNVYFGGVMSNNIVINSSSSISAVVPAGVSTGNVNLSVTNTIGTASTTFNVAVPVALSVTKVGTGTVTSSPAGIDCGSACTANFATGASVTLTASAATGWTFSAWTGACTGTTATCTVSMSAAKSVTATFKQNTRLTYTGTLSAAKGGAVTLSATLLAADGTPLSGQSVRFVFAGVTYTGTTLSNGTVTISGSIKAPTKNGNYTIQVSYAGSTSYVASSTTATLSVR